MMFKGKVDFEKEWKCIETLLIAFLTTKPTHDIQLSDFLMRVFTLGNYDGKRLYDTIKKFFDNYTQQIRTNLTDYKEEDFLEEYARNWRAYFLGMQISEDLFAHLDKNWSKQQTSNELWNCEDDVDLPFLPYYKLGIKSWRDQVFMNIKDRIIYHWLKQITLQRMGQKISTDLIIEISNSVIQLCISERQTLSEYHQYLEKAYLDDLKEYYIKETNGDILKLGIIEYCKKSYDKIEEEYSSSIRFLPAESSIEKINQAISDSFISQHKNEMYGEFLGLLQNDRMEDLRIMISLLLRVENAIQPLLPDFSSFVYNYSISQLKPLLFDTHSDKNIINNNIANNIVNNNNDKTENNNNNNNSNNNDDNMKIENENKNDQITNDQSKEEKEKEESKSTQSNTLKNNNDINVDSQRKVDLDAIAYIELLMKIYNHFMVMIEKIFKKNYQFLGSFDESFSKFINSSTLFTNSNLFAAHMLAKYYHILLTKSNQLRLDESEMENKIDSSMKLFKYIQDKDVFQSYYSLYLAYRLTDNNIELTSNNEDLESHIIRHLQSICGFDYISKLQKMFQDIKISSDLNDQFANYIKSLHENNNNNSNNNNNINDNNNDISVDKNASMAIETGTEIINITSKADDMEFKVLILTTGSWPLLPSSSSFSIPSQFINKIELFEKFYKITHHTRKLSWLFHCSTNEIQTRCYKQPYRLFLSTLLMRILLLFNQSNSYSYQQIKTETQLSNSELPKLLHLLCKSRLLLLSNSADPNNKNSGKLNPKSVFHFNPKFASKSIKVKLGAILREHLEPSSSFLIIDQYNTSDNNNLPIPTVPFSQSQSSVIAGLEEDRKLYLQATIVRIMKMRRELDHNQLLGEVFSQTTLRFKPTVVSIKKSIEQLLDKEFIERVDNKYRYLA